VTHGTCNYICTYINVIAKTVTLQLYLRHDFYNIIFKTTYKLYIASASE
jgi:hypothetical protein